MVCPRHHSTIWKTHHAHMRMHIYWWRQKGRLAHPRQAVWELGITHSTLTMRTAVYEWYECMFLSDMFSQGLMACFCRHQGSGLFEDRHKQYRQYRNSNTSSRHTKQTHATQRSFSGQQHEPAQLRLSPISGLCFLADTLTMCWVHIEAAIKHRGRMYNSSCMRPYLFSTRHQPEAYGLEHDIPRGCWE